MSDNQVVDKIAPWTIKAVATETRQTVIEAARLENLTVGQWLEKRVREWADQSQTSSDLVISQGRPRADGLQTQSDLPPDGAGKPKVRRVYNQADPVEIIRAALDVAPLLTDEARNNLMRSAGAAARRLLVAVGR